MFALMIRVQSGVPRVLLHVDGCADTEREGDQHDEQHQVQRTDDPVPHAGPFGNRGKRRREDLASTVLEDRKCLDDDLAHQHEQDAEREDQREEQSELEDGGADVPLAARECPSHLFACGDRPDRRSRHQYCLRTLRTKRSDTTFRLKVIRKSSMPTKKKL